MSRVIEPEMCGKIIDKSHFDFHVIAKGKILNAWSKLKGGADFINALSKTNFTTDKRWLKNSCNDPNVRVLLEILEEYKANEHRPTRAKVLAPLIEYAIALYASDLFYKERGEWFLYKIISRSGEMRFASCFIDPNNWYPKTRNIVRDKYGKQVFDFNELEQDPNVSTIEQDYMTWYGIDVTKQIDDLDPELVKKIIADNQQWMKDNNVTFTKR